MQVVHELSYSKSIAGNVMGNKTVEGKRQLHGTVQQVDNLWDFSAASGRPQWHQVQAEEVSGFASSGSRICRQSIKNVEKKKNHD